MIRKIIASGQVETRRLIWVTALLFALIAATQYFELPLSSFLPAQSPPAQEIRTLQNGDSNFTFVETNTTSQDGTKSPSLAPSEHGNDVEDYDGVSREEARQPETSLNESPSTIGNETKSLDSADDKNSDKDSNSRTEGGNEEEGTEAEPSMDGNIGPVRNNSDLPSPVQETPIPSSPLGSLVKKERSRESEKREGRSPSTEKKVLDVYTLSDMDDLLVQSRDSYYSTIPRWSAKVDRELQDAAFQIDNAPIVNNDPDLHTPLFRNVSMFKRSYELMEKTLQVYVYKEGGRPILHTPVLKGIYASEGWFMKLLESNKRFVTKSPEMAHLFYLPFSSRMLEESLYVVGSHSHKNLIKYLKDYMELIAAKHPFWNRTGGADHFLVACHDWAPSETRAIMSESIRALCNSDVKEGFVFGKDVSLPETYVQNPRDPLSGIGGNPPSERTTLAFFAGSMHGYLRPILLKHWQDKDPDMKIFAKLPKSKTSKKKKKKKKKGKKDKGRFLTTTTLSYSDYMRRSKFCICAKGYEVNSPRVVEAVFHECVPVVISDNFVPPFFGILNWESFAVFVAERDIPDLKRILLAIPEERYRELYMNVKKVQRHFLWHPKPQKYDIFHMILHSIWYNRLHRIRPS